MSQGERFSVHTGNLLRGSPRNQQLLYSQLMVTSGTKRHWSVHHGGCMVLAVRVETKSCNHEIDGLESA